MPAGPLPLRDRRIGLGVTGGIASYKSVALCRALRAEGARVDVWMTPSAGRFLTPLAFERLSEGRVWIGLPAHAAEAREMRALAQALDLFIVAPATATSLARLALGLAENALVAAALATPAAWLLAPAMEPDMWRHPATCRNVATVLARGATLVGPASGRLASGGFGVGRMAEPREIVAQARRLLSAAA